MAEATDLNALPSVEQLQQQGQLLNAELEDVLAQLFQYNRDELSPDNLRVGLANTQIMVNAITQLLMEKGVFSEQEWLSAVCQSMHQEIQMYKEILAEAAG